MVYLNPVYLLFLSIVCMNLGTLFAISGSLKETCVNGSYGVEIYIEQGTPGSGNCTCPAWIGSQCCQVLSHLQTKLPTCSPPCANGGVCINNDTCSCQTGYFGQRCEMSVTLAENLKPKLNPTLPLTEVFKPLSWYDGLEMSWSNRACMVKVHTKNAPDDAMFTAVSYKDGDTSAVFGNFTSGPIDKQGGIAGSDRYACLQVRCPSETLDGNSFNVGVDITVTSSLGTCKVSGHSNVNNFNAVKRAGTSDDVNLVLEYGNNYGSLFGVYISMGFLSKASYLAQQACDAGNHYDFSNSPDPISGAMVNYTCT